MRDLFTRRAAPGHAGMVKGWVTGRLGLTDADLVTVADVTRECGAPQEAPVFARVSEAPDDQQALFINLIAHYTGLANDEHAAIRLEEVTSVLDETYFVWYGPTDASGNAYFRVDGPTIVIEYSPQGMGGDPGDHIHGIYRDPSNDYGAGYIG